MTFLAFLTVTVAIAASVESSPDWNDLRVTWGINIFTKFRQQPRTAAEAEKQGFVKVGSETCDGTGAYNGFAYVKDNDYALTLIFDKNGVIAGIQHGISKDVADAKNFPPKEVQPPFVLVNGRYVVTAYFTDPSKICSEGRTEEDLKSQGTGTDLWIQTGNTSSDVSLVPREQKDLAGTKWTEGECFRTMGKHYWYDVTPDMKCESFFPVFLLYNGGKLNAFGWVMIPELSSDHYEHPDPSVVGKFMTEVPQCISDIKHKLSTMHIYLTSTPLLNFC